MVFNMQVRKDTLIRQKEIVSAARKLIVRYGSEHVTVRRMAHEIGVSEGAIYKHFKSKKDILSFMVDDIDRTWQEDIEKNFHGSLDSLETLENIIIDHLSAVEQRRGVSFQVMAEIISLGDKKLNKKVSDAIDNYLSSIKKILAVGVESGLIDAGLDLELTAKLFFSLTQGLVSIWTLNQYKPNLEQEFRSMWKIFLRAVRNKS
jgi:AcrR family transcriptional regulator